MSGLTLAPFHSIEHLMWRTRQNKVNATDAYLQNKFGYNAAIASGTEEDIWSVGGTRSDLTSAETMNIVSTSTDDDSGGSGALTVLVIGVDDNFDSLQEIVTMDGQSNVLTSNSYLYIYRMVVLSSGGTSPNVGTISATASSAATVQAEIPAGKGQTQMTHLPIPAGYTYFLKQLTISAYKPTGSSNTRSQEIELYLKPAGKSYYIHQQQIGLTNDTWTINAAVGLAVPEKSVIKFVSDSSENGSSCSVFYSGIMVNNDLL